MKLFGFWKYDLFPFMLGGELTEACPVDKYPGPGFFYCPRYQGWFKPFLVVSEKDGLAMKAKLDALTTQYRLEQEKLLEKFKQEATKIVGPLK
jgi:hypothetical protein